MPRFRGLAALLLSGALTMGCGARQSPAAGGTTPAAGGQAGAADPGVYHDPGVPQDVPTTTFDGGSANVSASGSGTGQAPSSEPAVEEVGGKTGNGAPATAGSGPPPPVIQPPGLDLSPQEKARRVQESLMKARAALDGSTIDAETGIAEAKAALAVDEKNLPAMLYLAHGNYAKGYYDKAEYVLERAEKAPNGTSSAKLYVLEGLVYEATNREDEAEAAYRQAVALNPQDRAALLNLGVYHIKNKRYTEAKELYERLTGPLHSQSPAAWTNLGSAYRGLTAEPGIDDATRRSRLLAAERAYKRAVTLDKSYGPAYYDLGLLYLDADPFPLGDGDMDMLVRLKQAQTYFEEYAKTPGADTKRAKEQSAVAQKLIDRENKIRERQRQREERRKKLDQN